MSKWMPTNKWINATLVIVGTILGMALTGDGINTDPEVLTVLSLVTQRAVAYFTSNANS